MSQHLTVRPFQIRLAQPSDIDSLVRLEHLAWDANLVAPREVLLGRLHTSPTTCFVCEMGGKVVACLYTQRVRSLDDIFTETFMGISAAHVAGGPVVQLIAISSDPEVSKLGIGSDLRCFALHLARLDPGVETVCAVTRARNYRGYNGTMEEYCDAHSTGRLLDPILDFHTGYGAKIVSCVHKFRPEDTDNNATGVLIQYQIRNLPGSVQHEGPPKDAVSVLPAAKKKARVATLDLLRSIMDSIGYPVDEDDLNKGFFEYDMDSLELVQIRNKLGDELGRELPATLLLDFPSVQSLAEELDKEREEESDGDAVDGEEPGRLDSRELLSGLFADLGQSIDGDAFDQGFFDFDMDSLDLVRVKNQLSQLLSIELPPTLLLDYPTSRALVQYLDKVRGREEDDAGSQQQEEEAGTNAQEGTCAHGSDQPMSGLRTTWEAMTGKMYAEMQVELMKVLAQPKYQQYFFESAKRFYPNRRVEYIMDIEPLLVEAQGPLFMKRGLVSSCDPDEMQEARQKSWACLLSLAEKSPQLVKNSSVLYKITRQDASWGGF